MSTGFSCNLGFPIPQNWAFDQFFETLFDSYPPFPLDKVAYSARDTGFSKFDKTPDFTEEEIENQNTAAQKEIIQMQFFHDVLNSFGFEEKLPEININYTHPILLGTYSTGNISASIDAAFSSYAKYPSDAKYHLHVDVTNGELSVPLMEKIEELTEELSKEEPVAADIFETMLKNTAFKIKEGDISFSVTVVSLSTVRFTMTVSHERTLDDGSIVGASVELHITITLSGDNSLDTEVLENAMILSAVLLALALLCYFNPTLIPVLLRALPALAPI